MGDIRRSDITPSSPFSRGTVIRFKPDPTIFKFDSLEFDFDKLARRMDELAYLNAGLRLRYGNSLYHVCLVKHRYCYYSSTESMIVYIDHFKMAHDGLFVSSRD